MKKSTEIVLYCLIGLYICAYAVTEAVRPGGLGYILSPIGALGAGAVTLAAYIRTGRVRKMGVIWLCFSLACFSWAAADVILAVYALGFGVIAEDFPVVMFLYTCSNTFLLAAVGVFATSQFKRWNRAKLLLDAVMFSAVSLFTIWILLYNRSQTIMDVLLQDGPFSVVSILADFIIVLSVAVWFLSVKSGRVPIFVIMAMVTVTAFSLTDLMYWQVSYMGGYYPGSMLDVAAIVSLLAGAVGGVLRMCREAEKLIPAGDLGTRTGRLIKEAIMLVLPLVAMAIAGFVLTELLVFIMAAVIYKGLSVHFEAEIKKEQQLDQEKKLNEELGLTIEHHTRELRQMNKELWRKNEELIFLSNHDTLTNLYNRRFMLDKLQSSLAGAKPGQIVALMYIDLDRFKVINDMYGHDMGDKVLLEVSRRLIKFAGESVMLARMGGDEFVIVLTGLTDSREPAAFAGRIIEQCSHNIYVDDYVFCPSLCIGISIYPLDAEDVGTMMKNADIALYHAKEQGVGRFAVFSRMIRQKSQRRNTIEMLLRADDITSEFSVYYQPQFSIPDQKLIAAEALIRWHNAQLGPVSPAEFIPIAEETDRINHIGMWVLGQATAQAAAWNSRYGGDLVIGVNISPKQLNSSRLMEKLQSLSGGGGFNPAWLDIEITESVALEGEYRLVQIFNLFKSIGMSVSVDDFGAGYSSVMALKQYSFDRIKIAKPLIDSITASDRNEQIVRALVLLAKSIGMKTIAEGVETRSQLAKLVAIGCDQIQGYLLGEPVPAEEFEALYLNPPKAAGAAY